MSYQILCGDALKLLRALPEASVQCVVTSPPYWGLRTYDVEGQLGMEKTPEEFVGNMVAVFQEVRRVLDPRGTAWVNLGDCYHQPDKGATVNKSPTSTISSKATWAVIGKGSRTASRTQHSKLRISA